MKFDPILPQERIDAMVSQGLWPNQLITDHMDDAVATSPDQVAVTDYNSMTGRHTTLSYRQLRRISDRIALGLVAMGIQPGDVIGLQLPNWWHYAAFYLAAVRIGAVVNPLMPIFRHRELEFMLGYAAHKAVVIPRRFRGYDHVQMLAELRGKLPKLEHVIVIDGEDDATSCEALLLNRRWEDELDAAQIFAERRPGPNDITELAYTSGTTGTPKGIMHTSNTLMCKAKIAIEHMQLTQRDTVLMGSPIAHQTGFMYGMVMSIVLHAKSVLMDIWDPIVAAQRIQDERCTYTLASTPFVSDLTYNEGVARYDMSSMKLFLTAGAPIPRVLVQDAKRLRNIFVMSAWGMSENGVVTATRIGDGEDKIVNTDGAPVPGQEVRVVDADGKVLPPGAEGRLQARCCTQFVGYLGRPEAYEMHDGMWFETGDNARMDEDGYIRITGRSKDILIRGGENIPVVEIESVIYEHPAVEDVAIVAMPDERLGERGCAFVKLNEGAALTFADLIDFLSERRVARNYLPERLEVLPDFPRTPSGKIQKFKLREVAKDLRPER